MNTKTWEMKTTRAMGLAYLARALSDFKNYPIQVNDECNQILSILVGGVSAKNWQFVIKEIYYRIEQYIYGGIQWDWDKKAAMIASLDYEGSRTANLNEQLKLCPHIHALFIFPDKAEIDIKNLEWYLNKHKNKIGHEVKCAMSRKGISDADQLDYQLAYLSINVDHFHKKPNVCFTSAISYQIKATSFLNPGDLITPVVYPFDLKIMNLKKKRSKVAREKERAHQLLRELIFDPRKYFSGELFEIDLRHNLFLKEYQKLTNWPEDALLDLRTEAIRYIENGNYDRLGEMAIAIRNCLSATTNKYSLKETIA